jgi:hypothetical protein
MALAQHQLKMGNFLKALRYIFRPLWPSSGVTILVMRKLLFSFGLILVCLSMTEKVQSLETRL